MTRLPDQFLEDLALRNAARDVFLADISHARTSISAKGAATRVASRIGDGAKDVIEVARVQADDNRGVLAILIGAILLWFARQPLLELLGLSADSNEAEEIGEDEACHDPNESEPHPDPEIDMATRMADQSNNASIPSGEDDE